MFLNYLMSLNYLMYHAFQKIHLNRWFLKYH
jgi:hypothetical protein